MPPDAERGPGKGPARTDSDSGLDRTAAPVTPAASVGEPSTMRRYPWEQALRREEGPKGMRLLVLLVLGTYMDTDGSRASASQRTLAAATGLKERAVRGHLSASVAEGWLLTTRRGHRRGDGEAISSEFQATLPARLCHLRDISTGTDVPLEDLNRHERAPQLARARRSTGTRVPPTKRYQEDQRASGPREPFPSGLDIDDTAAVVIEGRRYEVAR